MDKNKAIEKIKKCLALGKSANEHEAAQALKQAQALMREYGISDADVALSDIKKHACTAKTANPTDSFTLSSIINLCSI
jgi:hypothetical protein